MGDFDPGLFLWTLVTFGVLLTVLGRFAFKPLGKLLAEREKRIADSLEAADLAKEAAQKALKESNGVISEARTEAGRIINEGHRIVEDMKREASSNAKTEADLIIKHARKEIDQEVQRSLTDLKGTVANLAVRISRQILRQKVDDQHHDRLADDFIERLKKSHASRKT